MQGKLWLVVGVGVLLSSAACGQSSPMKPSDFSVAGASSDEAVAVTTSSPVVTLRTDLTVSPAWVSVPAGGRVKMVNSTTRSTRIQSSNCWEFNLMALPAGYAKYTQAFSPAGKTCDYWAMNGDSKIFVGRVTVQ